MSERGTGGQSERPKGEVNPSPEVVAWRNQVQKLWGDNKTRHAMNQIHELMGKIQPNETQQVSTLRYERAKLRLRGEQLREGVWGAAILANSSLLGRDIANGNKGEIVAHSVLTGLSIGGMLLENRERQRAKNHLESVKPPPEALI